MDKIKSQKKLSKYRSIMLREGLSFSDYFDDSVPYGVKPVYNLTPMEEAESDYIGHADIPTQSKDLFKGLWESEGQSIFIGHMMPNDLDLFKTHLAQLFAYLQKELQLKTVPGVKLISDEKNASKILGKTAYYNPDEKLVVLYITNRHQKDILRSFAHEIIHHWQHENEKLHEGDDKKSGTNDPQYAQNNPWLRQMEKQAYLLGNILFRDWEDQKKAEDKKSGNDGKSKKKVKELHGKGNVKHDSHTPIMKQKYSPSHPYRKHTEGPQEMDLENGPKNEQTYSLGNEYPPKKMNYKG